jgi:hypothetical protein
MKRSIFSLFALSVLILSCRKNQTEQHASSGKTLEITLNGIDKTTARKEIEYFDTQKANDPTPLSTSIWFDRSMIQHMAELLNSEHADGIRIYFISAFAESAPLKNSIAMVSTKAWGKNPDVRSGTYHRDYYEHSATAALFSNIKTINGLISHNITDDGMLLYNTCTTCTPDVAPNNENPHQLTRQAAEKMAQGFGGHPISATSEWFDLKLFQSFAEDKNTDGLRIYFATKTTGMSQPGSDAFVLIKTIPSSTPGTHIDYFGSPGVNRYKVVADGGQDEGELCPPNCN